MAISGTVTRHPTVVTATMTDAYSPSRPYRGRHHAGGNSRWTAPAIRFTSTSVTPSSIQRCSPNTQYSSMVKSGIHTSRVREAYSTLFPETGSNPPRNKESAYQHSQRRVQRRKVPDYRPQRGRQRNVHHKQRHRYQSAEYPGFNSASFQDISRKDPFSIPTPTVQEST